MRVGASLPMRVGASLPMRVGASLPMCVGASLPMRVGASLPMCVGASLPMCVGASLGGGGGGHACPKWWAEKSSLPPPGVVHSRLNVKRLSSTIKLAMGPAHDGPHAPSLPPPSSSPPRRRLHPAIRTAVERFSKDNLHHVETVVRQKLPDVEGEVLGSCLAVEREN